MDFLDQPMNPRGHNQKISNSLTGRIPVRMWRSVRHEHARAGMQLYLSISHFYAESSFQHIPRLVIISVKMQGSDPARRIVTTACILPFGDHKVIVGESQNVSCKRRRNTRSTHKQILRGGSLRGCNVNPYAHAESSS